ncbi:MAG: methionyl-tRNA formyltransferase [Dehalococcoidales bacterium]|nr:methionyl-tRNA formyltransferase [Dehalococcoidales bacterium]
MRVVFMGTPEFAVLPLECLIGSKYNVVAVYTPPDRPSGRGRSLRASPVKRVALARGLPVFQPTSLKPNTAVNELAGVSPDVIVVAAYGQLLPAAILSLPRYGCINLHPSLLPHFRGASPVAAAILAGAEFTGVSIMLMDKGMDTGPVLAQAQIPVAAKDTTGSLMAKLSRLASQLLLEVLPSWLRGELSPRPQNEAEASYCPRIAKSDGEIDWQLPVVEIWRRGRAFSPWPGCYTRWRGKQLKIIESLPLLGGGESKPGQVVALMGKEAGFGIGTGEGILGVLRVQMAGRQVVLAADFVRGQPQFIGAQLPSS